jgi:hypothetical protein
MTPEHVRQSVVQPWTLRQILDMPPNSEWTLERVHRALDAGVPLDGRLWVEIIPAGSTVIDGEVCTVMRFEWRATWMWGEHHYPMSATGHGETADEAFEALLAALG